LHWNHMRQPGAASWQTTATLGQRSTLNRLCGRWLRERGYSLDPNPAGAVPNSRVHLLERLNIEADIAVGRLNFLIRAGTQRFPATARAAKRLLGIPTDSKAGATAWSDPVSSHRPASQPADPTASAI
jgi:hypothetical protein